MPIGLGFSKAGGLKVSDTIKEAIRHRHEKGLLASRMYQYVLGLADDYKNEVANVLQNGGAALGENPPPFWST